MKLRRSILKIYGILEDHFGDLGWWPAEGPFEVIVGAILTQNTSWRNVEKAIENLKKEKLLDPGKLREAGAKEIEALIKSSGYYRVKAKRLEEFLDFFFREYGGSVEDMFSENWRELRRKLLSVKGIGEETADSILLYAGQKPVFVVDQYTKRICSRHGIIDGKATYGDIQKLFMDRLPEDVNLFNQYHALLVYTGKEFCRKEPLCASCPLRPMMAKKTRDQMGI